jgi:hypothetical protein
MADLERALLLAREARVLLDRLRWQMEGQPDPFDVALARLRAAHPPREDGEW